MGRAIAIFNQKGGVGKTTTNINLGASLALKNKKVLMLDIDPQGNTTSGYGVNKKSISASSYDLLVGTATIDQAIIKTNFKGVDIIPSDMNLAGAEIELISIDEREKQ